MTTKGLGLNREQKHQFECCIQFVHALRDFLVLMQRYFEPQTPAPKIPSWAIKAFEAWWDGVGRNLRVISDWSPDECSARDAGFGFGYLNWMRGYLEELDKKFDALELPPVKPLPPKAQAVVNAEANSAFDGLAKDEEVASMFEYLEARPTLPEKILSAPPSESNEFYAGAAKGSLGLSGTPDGSIEKTDAAEFYLLLVMFHWHVSTMKTTAELHAWLGRMLGKNRAGSKERVRKVCQRLGLKFRGRGRPVKMGQRKKR